MSDDQPAPSTSSRPWLVYSVLRLLVFIGTAGFFAIFGLNGFWLLIVAVVVSGFVSLLVLRPQREAVAAAQLTRRERRLAERDEVRARLDDA
jgi:UPF0716 family protein affecting phage T7 exclusion